MTNYHNEPQQDYNRPQTNHNEAKTDHNDGEHNKKDERMATKTTDKTNGQRCQQQRSETRRRWETNSKNDG